MVVPHIVDLHQCSEFRQTLEACPPAIVHGAACLSAALVAAAIAWAGLTPANLVVRSAGRVRPADDIRQVFAAANPLLDGRVAEVAVCEGSRVQRGQSLLRLDTAKLDNDLAEAEDAIRLSEAELANLDDRASLLAEHSAAAMAKASAELEQAKAEIIRAAAMRSTAVDQGTSRFAAAQDQLTRLAKLLPSRAVTEQAYNDAQAKVDAAQAQLRAAQLPVDHTRLGVAEQALSLVGREAAIHRAELDAKRMAVRRTLESAKKELANLRIAKSQSVICSPSDGVVTRGQIRVGDVVELGKPVLELAREQSYCFETFISGEDVGRLKVGLPAIIKFDAYEFQRYGSLEGEVDYIAPDSAVARDQRAADKSAAPNLVYKVRIRLKGYRVGRGDLCGEVKLGLSGQAEIVTGRESVLSILLRRIRSSVSLG